MKRKKVHSVKRPILKKELCGLCSHYGYVRSCNTGRCDFNINHDMLIASVGKCVYFCRHGHSTATIYVSDNFVIKSSRQHPKDGRVRSESYVVTVGTPNYKERQYIKKAKKKKNLELIPSPCIITTSYADKNRKG